MKKKLSLKVESLEERIAPTITFDLAVMPSTGVATLPSDFGPALSQVGNPSAPWTGHATSPVLDNGTPA